MKIDWTEPAILDLESIRDYLIDIYSILRLQSH